MDLQELENYYFEKKLDGVDFSTIRSELQKRDLTEEEIKIIIRSIDNKILEQEKIKSQNIFIKENYSIGIILLIGGVILTFGSFLKIIDLKGYTIFSIGPIIIGLSLMIGNKYRKSKSKFGRFNNKS